MDEPRSRLRRLIGWFDASSDLRWKLSLVLALALAPALALSVMLVHTMEEQRRFAAAERAGLHYMQAVWPVMTAAKQDRRAVRAGELERLDDARRGFAEQVAPLATADRLPIALRRQAPAATVAAEAGDLLRAISVASRFHLDPATDSHMAMHLLSERAPRLAQAADDAARVRVALAAGARAASLLPQAYRELSRVSAATEELQRVYHQLASANPAMANRLNTPLRRVIEREEALRAALAAAIAVDGRPSAAALADISVQELALQQELDLFWRATAIEADAVLAEREAALWREIAATMTALAALILLGVGMGALIQRGLRRPIDRLVAYMQRMATAGDTAAPPPYQTYANEIGAIANAVEVFRQGMLRSDRLAEELVGERNSLERRVKERTLELEQAVAAAESATRAKSAFLATMSHEIRTPLNGVLGMADALARMPLPPEAVRLAAAVSESGRALTSLLNDILDLSKVEAGMLDLDEAPFEVRAHVAAVGDLYREAAAAKGLALEVEVRDSVPAWLSGDALRLRQILQNLIANAIKFTEHGYVRLLVERQAGKIAFSVHDTGIGIAPDAHDRVFAPFVQADGSTTRRFGGTGLGLSLSRQIAERMGGRRPWSAGRASAPCSRCGWR